MQSIRVEQPEINEKLEGGYLMNKAQKLTITAFAGRLMIMAVFVLALLGASQTVHAAGKLIEIPSAGVSSSSYMAPYRPERAVDGSTAPASRWVCAKASGVDSQWLMVDLGGNYRIDNIEIKGMSSAGWSADYDIKNYLVQESSNGTSFNIVTNSTPFIAPFTTRYVRILVNTGNGFNNKWAAITELKIYGTTNPAVNTDADPDLVGATSAVVGGNVTSLGNDTIAERGIVYSTDFNKLTMDSGTVASAGETGVTGSFTATLSNLQPNTTYYYKAYVTNAFGTAYGSSYYSFTTMQPLMGGKPAIQGDAKYGQTLAAIITGITYTPATNDDVPTYRWKRDGVDIPGATASTYTLTQADIGHKITVTVTADGIHATGSATSDETPAVDKADGPAAPGIPALAGKTHNSVTLEANADYEFRIDGGAWQDSNVFTGLSPETSYTFTARVKETETRKASAESPGLTVSTYAAYTVSFDSQGGSMVASIQDVMSGSTITEPPAPSLSGYTFGGWYKEAACTNIWNFNTDTVTGNITLYAK